MKIKTTTLIGQALDFAVTMCLGVTPHKCLISGSIGKLTLDDNCIWSPSTFWAQGGPIIEREKIGTRYTGFEWSAGWHVVEGRFCGPTPLIAAMRCYVASKLGDEVDIPDEMAGGVA